MSICGFLHHKTSKDMKFISKYKENIKGTVGERIGMAVSK
jgi:hypothetical protein